MRAIGSVFLDRVRAAVDEKNVVIRVDIHAVRFLEETVAPSLDEVSVAIKDDHRIAATVVGVDAVSGVDRDSGDLAELEAIRQRAPALDNFVAIIALSKDARHRVLSFHSL